MAGKGGKAVTKSLQKTGRAVPEYKDKETKDEGGSILKKLMTTGKAC